MLRWHDLIRDWWGLLEGNVLSLAERILINDLLDLADLEFPITMPFSSLRLAGSHPERLMRRLRVLLLEATGILVEDKVYDHAHVRLDTALGTRAVQRAALSREGSSEDSRLILAVWPGELKAQAQRLYSNQRAHAVAALAGEDGWEVGGTPHLAFRNAPDGQRWYFTALVGADEYATIWEENLEQVGGHRAEMLLQLWGLVARPPARVGVGSRRSRQVRARASRSSDSPSPWNARATVLELGRGAESRRRWPAGRRHTRGTRRDTGAH